MYSLQMYSVGSRLTFNLHTIEIYIKIPKRVAVLTSIIFCRERIDTQWCETYCYEFPPAQRASDRVSLIAAASPTERTIQSRLSGDTPETSHGCVLNAHHGLVNIPPARDRVNHRIVDIRNYSRGQTTERPYLNEACLDTNRLNGSFRSGITERCIITRPRWT